MNNKYWIGIGSVLILGAVIGLALTKVDSVRSGPPDLTPTPSGWPIYPFSNPNGRNNLPMRPTVVPPKVTDLFPNIAQADKVSVIIRHADGTEEEFLITPDSIDAFIKRLPVGDKLEVIIPPQSLIGIFPTTPTPNH